MEGITLRLCWMCCGDLPSRTPRAITYSVTEIGMVMPLAKSS